jgi:hypothetical protein
MNYVKERFSKQEGTKQKSPEDVAMQDMDEAAKTGKFGTREELLIDYRTNRSRYDAKMTGFKQVLEAQTNVNIVKNNIGALSGQSDSQVDTVRAGFSAVFDGSMGANVITTAVNDKEQVFKDTLKLMESGDPKAIDPTKFQVLVALHTSQMKTNIESARKAGYNVIDAYLAKNPNVSDAKRKELYADQDRNAESSLRLYADDKGIGMLAMANVLKNYRDKSLTEQQMVLDLAIKQQSAMQNNPMVMAFYGLGASRENLKRTNPDFYDYMITNEKRIQEAVRGIRNDVAVATDLADVKRVFLQSEQSGAAVPVDPLASRTNTRAAHQALNASAVEILKKTSLLPAEINIVSAAFATSVATGANSLTLANGYKKYGEQIMKLSNTDQAIIKSNVSKSVSGAVIDISDVKRVLEAKYKTTLTLGVNDAGEISVVPKMVANTTPAYGTSPGMYQRTIVDPTYSQAANEFMKQVKPVLNNIVYGTSMLTQKDAKVVGTEFATTINNNQPYSGFYNSQAQPIATPTPVAPTPVTPTPTTPAPATAIPVSTAPANVDLETQVRSTLDKMKALDPTMNTEYVFNAYKRSSPEKQKELAKLFATNSVRMADLSGAR